MQLFFSSTYFHRAVRCIHRRLYKISAHLDLIISSLWPRQRALRVPTSINSQSPLRNTEQAPQAARSPAHQQQQSPLPPVNTPYLLLLVI